LRPSFHNFEYSSLKFFVSLPGVDKLHDLNIWPMSTTEAALTCHLVMPGGSPGDVFLMKAAHELKHRFAIDHTAIQIETDEATACALAPDQVVAVRRTLCDHGPSIED
jgi:cobalt-zinc-cadmium efflux system protein